MVLPVTHNTDDTIDDLSSEPCDEEPQQACSPSVDAHDVNGQCARQLTSLLLKWQEGRQLPESTVNEIANDIINFATEFKGTLQSVDMKNLEHLRTKLGRENEWKSIFTFVSPQTIHLSNQDSSECFEYIPLLETLRAVAAVRNLFEGTEENSSTLLRDMHDGTYFKQHSIFKNASTQKLLALQLYFDEFELCNPLGSKRGKHKVLAGYLTILNLPPKCRSKLTDKYLVLLAKTSTVSKFTLHKILEPLVNDICQLETNGIDLNGEIVKGSLLLVSGDNLSSHQLGGFRECFSSGRICRFCLASKGEINEKWHERDFIIRTKQMHAHHVQLTKQDPSLSNAYGITGESCLSPLHSFDVTKGLPPDVMHDLFEGVIPLVMKCVIRHLISNRVFTLDQLNDRLAAFAFQGADKKSKIPPLSRQAVFGTSVIKGSAAEKLCFFRFFSLLVGDSVQKGNAAYEVYLTLRAVVDIVLAPQVSRSAAAYLKVLVEDFYDAFRETFPDVNIIPKMHYLIHYPRLLLMYGPLSKLSCMRFEAKHQFFKSLAKRIRNFKNICSTLSRRHQMHLMYALAQPQETYITVGSKSIDPSSLPDLLKDRFQDLGLLTTNVCSVTSVTVSEREVAVGYVLPIIIPNDGLPHFAEVTLIAMCSSQLFVLATLLSTKYFDNHIHAFLVERTTHSVIIENIAHCGEFFDLLYVYKHGNHCCVSPRFAFFTDSDD